MTADAAVRIALFVERRPLGGGQRMRRTSGLLLLVLATCIAACDSSLFDSTPIDGVPPGQVTFHFKMHGDVSGIQDFRAATNDPAVLAAVRAELLLPENERRLFIIGPIGRGNGGQNLEWNWHFLPAEWDLTEFAIELCDGNAVLVSQDVDYWVDTVGQFCPWCSYAAHEVFAEP
jgi:hypothetical protein